jgi:hypothetical protein
VGHALLEILGHASVHLAQISFHLVQRCDLTFVVGEHPLSGSGQFGLLFYSFKFDLIFLAHNREGWPIFKLIP